MHPPRWYFALAFAISWTGVVLAATHADGSLMFVAMLLGPSLAAIALAEGTRGLRELAHGLRRA